MRARTKRLWMVGGAAAVLMLAATITLVALEQTLTYFYTPKDIAEKGAPEPGLNAKLGGFVAYGTVAYDDTGGLSFLVIDEVGEVTVTYRGIVPDLFREGQGVIAEGSFVDASRFEATRILAKHDENYVPREMVDMVKAEGQWKGN